MTAKEVSILMKREEELRSRLEKKDAEWTKKLERREAEIAHEMLEKHEDWAKKEQALMEKLQKQNIELESSRSIREGNNSFHLC